MSGQPNSRTPISPVDLGAMNRAVDGAKQSAIRSEHERLKAFIAKSQLRVEQARDAQDRSYRQGWCDALAALERQLK